ncbi:hAT dimerization domain-containing transposase-related protein [Tanacetum coccineum]
MVGAKNVVQMVTDNAANYKAAGKMLTTRYRHMVWSPCAAHCLNLILKDVSELDNVKHIITLASRVTVFIYNHKWPLSCIEARYFVMMPGGIYRDGEGEFSRISAVKGRSQHCPDEWWRLFARKYPKIQEFAIKILSQTASSSGCERNWSVFERIHTKRRNRLEHKRLNDRVYVHYKRI